MHRFGIFRIDRRSNQPVGNALLIYDDAFVAVAHTIDLERTTPLKYAVVVIKPNASYDAGGKSTAAEPSDQNPAE